MEWAFIPGEANDVRGFDLLSFNLTPGSEVYADKAFNNYDVEDCLLTMVKQAAQKLKEVLHKSAPTQSRARISIHGDDSVIERIGKQIRTLLLLVQWSIQARDDRQ